MLQARGNNIRSGWRTMFGTFTFAAKESYGRFKVSCYLWGVLISSRSNCELSL